MIIHKPKRIELLRLIGIKFRHPQNIKFTSVNRFMINTLNLSPYKTIVLETTLIQQQEPFEDEHKTGDRNKPEAWLFI